MVLIPIFTLSK